MASVTAETKWSGFNIYPRTFQFGVRIVKLVDQLPRTTAGIEIGRQLLRSGTSIGANTREAGSAESHRDFVHKLSIARKEAQETHFWLEILAASVAANNQEVNCLLDECEQLARILYAMSHKRSDEPESKNKA